MTTIEKLQELKKKATSKQAERGDVSLADQIRAFLCEVKTDMPKIVQSGKELVDWIDRTIALFTQPTPEPAPPAKDW